MTNLALAHSKNTKAEHFKLVATSPSSALLQINSTKYMQHQQFHYCHILYNLTLWKDQILPRLLEELDLKSHHRQHLMLREE